MPPRCARPVPATPLPAGSPPILPACPAATISQCWPISRATSRTAASCSNCAKRCAIIATLQPASNSDRDFCTRPARPIKAARTAACFCRSPPTIATISPFPGIAPVSAWSRARKRAATSTFCSSAAGALCASISRARSPQDLRRCRPRFNSLWRDRGHPMQIGVIGLGRMGGNITRRLIQNGHEPVVYDHDPNAVAALGRDGAIGAKGLDALVDQLRAPRAIWLMLPAGKITDDTIVQLARLLAPDDIIIDGGNTFWKDDIRRAKTLKGRSIHYVDVGTSGGVWGLERGYCMMIGGPKAIVDRLDPVFKALAPGLSNVPRTPGRDGRDPRAELGYLHCGPSGAGHFVKMIHNGIEYGLMQAFAEGFDILKNANSPALPEDARFDLDVADIAEVWRRGSVISSWLLDLTASALASDPKLSGFEGVVEDSGEGRWTVMAAIEEAVPADVLSAALYTRFRSRHDHTFAEKILSAMRKGFGAHVEPKDRKAKPS